MSNYNQESKNSLHSPEKLAAFLKEQMPQTAQSFNRWLSAGSSVNFLISQAQDAVSDLKEINTILTEISKTSNALSKSHLSEIADNSFDTASKYGKAAVDYLSGVLEASRAGYKNAEGIAELSLAVQTAGGITAELADQFITAADNAYQFGGSVEKLTKVLDGSNYIADQNSLNMADLAEGMSVVGSTAASFGVNADETAAALGAMIAATQQSGSEAANALNTVLLLIRQVTDKEKGIDAEGLARYKNACDTLNVHLEKTRNGIVSLRDPMEVLRDLSAEYNKLEFSDSRRTNLLDSVGSEQNAVQFDALLRQWDTYETMLQQYAAGTGSMAAESEKTANSWEGSLNRIGNTWKSTINNIVDSDAVIAAVNGLNSLLSVINNVTDKLGSLGTIGLGAGIFSIFKNVDYLKTPVCPLCI